MCELNIGGSRKLQKNFNDFKFWWINDNVQTKFACIKNMVDEIPLCTPIGSYDKNLN